jgi:hypothetical protein
MHQHEFRRDCGNKRESGKMMQEGKESAHARIREARHVARFRNVRQWLCPPGSPAGPAPWGISRKILRI